MVRKWTNENQKPVTEAYRNNWDEIFKKDKEETQEEPDKEEAKDDEM